MSRHPLLPLVLCLLVSVLSGPPTSASDSGPGKPGPGYLDILDLTSDERGLRRSAERRFLAAGDPSLIPGLVDALFFTPRRFRRSLAQVLEGLTGADHGREYYDWVRWVGEHPEIEPKEGYLAWKARLLSRIDPRYEQVLYDGAPSRIRIEEIVWGGVRIGGIPALDHPVAIPGSAAGWLGEDELVFGVALGGEARAYPLRIMDWHEMANDVIGGRPVTLSYCTLCRSGILYDSSTPAGGSRTFGTSGLLYRSNKLMIDQETLTLWSNLTGEPVVGRLAASPVRLEVLPMTLTTWSEWSGRHPDSSVLDLERLKSRFDFRYRPGAADAARNGVSFPVPGREGSLDRETEVYALRLDGESMAYPVDELLAAGLVQDRVGDTQIVLVAEETSGAVRVFEAVGLRFRRDGSELVDDTGRRWRITEEALVPTGPAEEAAPLPRVPGHVAFWFGWHAFYPDTGLWRGPG